MQGGHAVTLCGIGIDAISQEDANCFDIAVHRGVRHWRFDRGQHRKAECCEGTHGKTTEKLFPSH